MRSVGAAEFMRSKVPGVYIPDEIIERLKGVDKKRQRAEGKRICIEIIQQVREMPGVAGIHVMAYRQEELVAEIIEEAGLLPRPFRSDVPHATREASHPAPSARNLISRLRIRAASPCSTWAHSNKARR